ncbi:unnamed protein product [Larinioides sclopetarius]|uniref:MADF domain-containing protein n=1 Tax=Larinioides sclopetarius TaxID=280406 RepID=A0AAV2BG47_9ARAC
MQRANDCSNKKDDTKKDTCTIKFLELLLRYDYVWRLDCEEVFKLNLSEKDTGQFLNECSEFFPDLDEMEAVIKLKNIRDMYNKQLQKASQNGNESEFSWFSLADKLFQRPTTTKAWPLKQMVKSRGDMTDLQPLTLDDTSPSAHGEYQRSISPRNLGTETKCLPNIRKSNSLQSDTEETEPVMFKVKSPSVFIPTLIYSACRKACDTSANPKSLITDSTSVVSCISNLLMTGYSIPSIPSANMSPSIAPSGGNSVPNDSISSNSSAVKSSISPNSPLSSHSERTFDSTVTRIYLEKSDGSSKSLFASSPVSPSSILKEPFTERTSVARTFVSPVRKNYVKKSEGRFTSPSTSSPILLSEATTVSPPLDTTVSHSAASTVSRASRTSDVKIWFQEMMFQNF